MSIYIKSEQAETFEIIISNRVYPNSEDYWDGNFLKSNIKASVNGFSASFSCNLRTDELQQWEISIENFLIDNQASINFTTMEENINVKGARDILGLIVWEFLLQTTEEYTSTLRFVIKSSITEVERLRSEIKVLLNQYPVVGKP